MRRFFKDKRGETLVETLIAILIFTMASIAMYTMVTTSARINAQAKEKELAVEAQLVEAEEATDPTPGTGNVTMTIIDKNGTTHRIPDIPVEIYGDGLYAYFKKRS